LRGGLSASTLGPVASWQILQNASEEIRALLVKHDELRRADVQEVLQDWVDAQPAQATPEVLCACLIKALTDVAALCRQRSVVDDQDLRAALRTALGMPESKRPTAS
jgi:hypothetical protein